MIILTKKKYFEENEKFWQKKRKILTKNKFCWIRKILTKKKKNDEKEEFWRKRKNGEKEEFWRKRRILTKNNFFSNNFCQSLVKYCI